MMISTRGRYSLRMMLDLAENQKDGYAALRDIAERQGISKKYLEQIIPTLNRFNLLLTTRGYAGGYRLSRKPEEYTLGDVLRATEGSLAPVSCMETEFNSCPRQAECATLPVWQGLNKVINEYLDGITLQDILDQQKAHRGGGDYVI